MSETQGATPVCPYCGRDAELRTGADVHGHRPDLSRKRFWICVPCDARVGCHEGTDVPFGDLANSQLRLARMQAHRLFDRIWLTGKLSRGDAYAWLADGLGIGVDQCHIGMMNVEMCDSVVGLCVDPSIPECEMCGNLWPILVELLTDEGHQSICHRCADAVGGVRDA